MTPSLRRHVLLKQAHSVAGSQPARRIVILSQIQELWAIRNFFERQDETRRLSVRLAAVLAGSVLATALVLAGLATILTLLQVVVTTNFEVDPKYWLAVFANRFWLATFFAGPIVIGVAVQKTLPALESGETEIARQMEGKRVQTFETETQYQQLINVVEELSIVTGAP